MTQLDIFDLENHCLTKAALKKALFYVRPAAYRLTDSDIVGIAGKMNRGMDDIIAIVQHARSAEEMLIDASISQKNPAFNGLKFRQNRLDSTIPETLESVVRRLEKDYSILGLQLPKDLISRTVMKSQEWYERLTETPKRAH